MTMNRRSFLKLLSWAPAIAYAPLSIGKVSTDLPVTLLTDSELLQAATDKPPVFGTGRVIITYPGKPTGQGGKTIYNAETNQTTHIFTESGTFIA